MKSEHRLDPDYDSSQDEMVEGIERLIIQVMARKRMEAGVDTYNEFPKAFIKWVGGGIMVLAVSGIIGVIVMYGKLQAVEVEITALRAELTDVKRLIEPRYRGEPDGSNAR